METLIHLCRKDHSFARHTLWGAWAVFLIAAFEPAFITTALADAAAPIFALVLLAPLLLIFAATHRILRADSFTGGNAFIGTRPVTMTMLWLSKLLAIATFVLLPYLIAQIIGVLAMRVHLSPADWMLFLAEKKLLFGLPAAIALIVGTHTRNFVWATMLTLAFAIMILWLSLAILSKPGGMNYISEDLHLKASQWLVAQALIPMAAILLAWLWMARRRMSWSIGAAVSALVLIGGVSTHWKLNFVNRLAVSGTSTTPQLRITWLDEPRIESSTQIGNIPHTSVSRTARVEGVPEGWVAFPSGVRWIARFPDGRDWEGDVINSRTYGDLSRALLPSLGVELPLKDSFGLSSTQWFEAPTYLLHDRTYANFTLSGEAMIELDQPVVLANLPAKAGASASHGRFRYRLERVEATSGGIEVNLTAFGANLASRGDRMDKQDEIEILIINPETGKHTSIGHMSGGTAFGPGWITMTRTLRIDNPHDNQTIDLRAFLKDARLYLIGRSHGGTVRVPFEMPDIELQKATHR